MSAIPRSQDRVLRTMICVFPQHTNHYHTLFGGTAMSWLDQAAFMCATRWARCKVVTAHSSAIDFRAPVPEGSIVEIIATLTGTGRTSMVIEVEMHVEPMDRYERTLACRGEFVIVAVDTAGGAVPVPPLGALES